MKRSIWTVAGVATVVLLLAGAAYMAGRLLNPAAQKGDATSGMRISVPGEGGGMIEAQLEKADEIPDERPDALGFFARREDNSVFISETTGEGMMIAMGDDGSVSTNASDKETEVVVTSDTLIYVDATAENIDESQDGGVVKQTLKPGLVDEIGQYSAVMVWGEKRGDRVVARVLLYTPPPVIER
jgi:hypothetical protein